MYRTRVHSLFVSSDGYAAGDRVTLEKPIGGAEALFGKFDGRVSHGINGIDDPVTVDRAMFSMWAKVWGRRSWAAVNSVRSRANGPTTAGPDGGATNRRSSRRCSS